MLDASYVTLRPVAQVKAAKRAAIEKDVEAIIKALRGTEGADLYARLSTASRLLDEVKRSAWGL